ncbi:MAG: hypothetical protein L0Z55_01220 [Planctomycetes bacterium]|nr:hypothetical protein [Planctomycetota bacterium]
MTTAFTSRANSQCPRRPYLAPELIVHGSIEKLTGWVGGPWGEFLGGTNTGYNPWDGDGPWAVTGS